MFLHHLKGCYVSSVRFPRVMGYWSLLISQMCPLMNMQTQLQECSLSIRMFSPCYMAGFLSPVSWASFKCLSLQTQLKWINLYSAQHPRNHFGDLKFLNNVSPEVLLCPCSSCQISPPNETQQWACTTSYCKGLGNSASPPLPAWKPM